MLCMGLHVSALDLVGRRLETTRPEHSRGRTGTLSLSMRSAAATSPAAVRHSASATAHITAGTLSTPDVSSSMFSARCSSGLAAFASPCGSETSAGRSRVS